MITCLTTRWIFLETVVVRVDLDFKHLSESPPFQDTLFTLASLIPGIVCKREDVLVGERVVVDVVLPPSEDAQKMSLRAMAVGCCHQHDASSAIGIKICRLTHMAPMKSG